jgi:hypothetical protein
MWLSDPQLRRNIAALLSDLHFNSKRRSVQLQACSSHKTESSAEFGSALAKNIAIGQCCFDTDTVERLYDG